MIKLLMTLFTVLFFMDASSAFSASAEKWLCTRVGFSRTVRLVAASVGAQPCKVFDAKRTAGDTNDAAVEALEDAGTIKPIFFSNDDGKFCTRKVKDFLDDKGAHGWSCIKLL